jgi:diguanylate cyclase (GGDEF)-like protein
MVYLRLSTLHVMIDNPPDTSVVLTEQDHDYLRVMGKALIGGIISAVGIALVLGLILGRRLGSALDVLINAIRTMTLNGELTQEIPVCSKDEIGQLAAAFNTMNSELTQAHGALSESHDKIQTQAEELKSLSFRDSLTGLYNRRYFDQQAEQAFRQALRYQQSLSIMVGDLDHFKKINDTFSHAVGDEVLRQVARLLEAGTRKSDVVARYGGEEFVVLLPETDLDNAAFVCKNLRRAIASFPWQEIHPQLRVTMSIGVSDDLTGENVKKTVAAADTLLYQAKGEGRNRVVPPPLHFVASEDCGGNEAVQPEVG